MLVCEIGVAPVVPAEFIMISLVEIMRVAHHLGINHGIR